jgi:ribonucleoside-diphosphate reductase beta chain
MKKRPLIFDEQVSRKPDYYPWCQDFVNAMWAGHWTPNEFNFKSDVHDFHTILNEQERDIIKKALSAIGQVELQVKRYWANMPNVLKHPSLSDLGYTMAAIEVIHNIAYEKLLTVLDLHSVFEENLKLDIIQGRVKYLKKYLEKNYTDDKKQYIYSIVLFTLFVENVSLFSQFYTILWFGRYKNVLKDTNQQVFYTKNEELIHAQAGIKIIQCIRQEYPELFDQELEDRIVHEAKEAFKAESKIVDWMIGDYSEKRMNKEIVKEYIKWRINDSLVQIGFKKIYELDDNLYRDFEWMNEETLGNNMTDFFYQKPTEYSKKHISFNAEELF